MTDLRRDAISQTSSAKTRAQIRRCNAPCDARPAATKRQKGETESLAEEAALRLKTG
jgi:hypothetical protein